MDSDDDGCVFCCKTGVDIAHISICSFEDAKKKLVQKENSISVSALTELFNAVLMVKTYEHALPEDQALMYVCTRCQVFDMAEEIPRVCPSCHGLHTVVRANKYIKDLLES